MSDDFVDLTPAFNAELRRRHTRLAWQRMRQPLAYGIAIGFCLGVIALGTITFLTR